MRQKLIIPVCFTWLGLIIGISFLEAPLKFRAPGITIPLGLGIGRLVFSALNKLELVLAALALLSSFSLHKQRTGLYMVITIIAVLLFESFYLLPLLDERAVRILRGEVVEPAIHHQLYVICECVKLILLIAAGFFYLSKLNYNENRHTYQE